jgi:RNA polymerase sigma factor (TIGR02999 family)
MITRPEDQSSSGATESREPVARLLGEIRDGRREALDELFPLVYDELRKLAHRQRRNWQGNETLNTTALVHEAYLKLVDQRGATWDTEAHFLATAARAIRHILINYARDRKAQKRGGGWERVPLGEQEIAGLPEPVSPWEDRVVALDEALQRLAGVSERQARIVECRFFGGMTVEQTAYALGLSTPTVVRGWAVAQAWLRGTLGEAHA